MTIALMVGSLLIAGGAAGWLSIEIVGETEPVPVFGTIGDFPLRNQGTILKCLAETGPAVISVPPTPKSLYGGFSYETAATQARQA